MKSGGSLNGHDMTWKFKRVSKAGLNSFSQKNRFTTL
jgi:hypothetical protein